MRQNHVVRLVALSSGVGAKSGKQWYKALLKSHTKTKDGSPIYAELWITPEVGDECKRLGLVEDVDVIVEAGLDDFLRFQITQILPAEIDVFGDDGK